MASIDYDALPPKRPLWATFGWGLAAVLVLATVVRGLFILWARRWYPLSGDAWIYHHAARYLSAGRGFVGVAAWHSDGLVKQAADHPPLYIVFLAVGNLLGAHSPMRQQVLNGVLGVAATGLVALVGNRVAGPRAGVIAGVIAALYAGMWGWTGAVLSEPLAVLLLVGVVLLAYRYLEHGSRRRAIALAAVIGLAALTRSELLLLAPLLGVPALVVHRRAGRSRRELTLDGAAMAVTLLLVLAPWTMFNLSRFERPVLLGNGLGRALDSGSCPDTVVGEVTGFWNLTCQQQTLERASVDPAELDESEIDNLYLRHAVSVLAENKERLPVLVVARVGRMFQFWAPLQQLGLEQWGEGREWWLQGASFTSFYLMAGLAVAGCVALRRREVAVFPLVVPVIAAACAATVAFGTSRYRAPVEPCLAVLAGVAVDAIIRRVERRRAPRTIAAALVGDRVVAPDPPTTTMWDDEPVTSGAPRAATAVATRRPVQLATGSGGGRWDAPPEDVRPDELGGDLLLDAPDAATVAHASGPQPIDGARPFSPPLVISMVIALMLGVSGLGVWFVQATGHAFPPIGYDWAEPGMPPP